MSAAYYFIGSVCEHCGRGDEAIPIGTSAAGWCFGLYVWPEDDINSLEDWEKLWSEPNSVIRDEYEVAVTPAKIREIITGRSWSGTVPDEKWYRENSAMPGPNGLARHQIDGHYVLGHGEGTWDVLVGRLHG